jgi:hypothetical protein
MGSLFESQVYSERSRVPWAEIDLIHFAKEAAVSGSDADRKLPEAADACLRGRGFHSGQNDFQLTVEYRPDVASRFWFSVQWTGEDGERHCSEAQEIELCLWRAAILETNLRERMKRDREIAESMESPIKMILDCPKCKKRHVDDARATKPHKTHQCAFCGQRWRPDYRYTFGVADAETLLGINKEE